MGGNNGKILTISVAAYNAEKYLHSVLDSLLNPAVIDSLEIYVIDDGGKDNSLSIAKSYSERFPDTFQAVHKENGGWGSTVNYSIAHATGKYFKILDGDDCFDFETLPAFIEYLEKCDSDIVISSYESFEDESGASIEKHSPSKEYMEGIQYKIEDAEEKFPLAMHSFAVKTSVLQHNKISLKEKCLYRDMEFTAKALLFAETIQYYFPTVYKYRLGREGQSVSRSSYLKHIDEHADIVFTILAVSEHTEANKKRLLYELADGACLQQYLIYFYSNDDAGIKSKLMEFDSKISEYPAFYEKVKLPWHIKMAQRHGFTDYSLIMQLLNIRRKVKVLTNNKTQ